MVNIEELERIANQPSPEEARQRLAELRAQEQKQAVIEQAQANAEVLKERFNAEYSKLKADKQRIDSELVGLLRRVEGLALEREILETDGLTKLRALAQNLASQMGQAGMRPPQPGPFLTTEDVAKQLIMSENDGSIQKNPNGSLGLSQFPVSRMDSQTYMNLKAICEGDLRMFRVS